MFLPPAALGRAEILQLDFDQEADGLPDGIAANVVTWLIGVFYIRHSVSLALAVARNLPDNRFIAVANDRTMVKAFIASTPQGDADALTGSAVDILGKHDLSDLVEETRTSLERAQVRIGSNGHNTTFAPEEEAAYLELAQQLPWYREVLCLPPQPFSGNALADAAVTLGMPRLLLDQPD